MLRSTTSTRLGTIAADTEVPLPPHSLRLRDKLVLDWMGFFDRFRYGRVDDRHHTHFQHSLERAARRREGEVVRGIDRTLAALDRLIAAATIVAETPALGDERVPNTVELAALTGSDRHAWAQGVRDSRESNRRKAAQRERAEKARIELAQLQAERQHVLVEGDDIRILWREAFALNAARYARARAGFFGLRPAVEPEIPEYRHIDSRSAGHLPD